MPPTSPGSANYYLALNGTPNGPHNAAAVLELLRQGSIQGTTLICREGGAAWVPVAEMETALRLEAMPAPAPPAPVPAPSYVSTPPPLPTAAPPVPVVSGYGGGGGGGGGAPPSRYQPRTVEPAVVHDVPRDGTKPLRFIALLGALGLFFLPWLELRCAGVKSIRQTGLQTVTSGYSLDDSMFTMMEAAARAHGGPSISPEQFAALKDKKLAEQQSSSDLGNAWFTGGAMLCVVIGLGAALGPNGRNASGIMALLAIMCLGMQMLSGFPLHQEIEKSMKESIKKRNMTGDQEMVMKTMLGDSKIVAVEYTPWFYTELGLLGLTAAIGMAGGNRRRT